MAELAERFVGRVDEIGSMEAALDEVEGGRSLALEVVGAPGIGKTRLLAEVGARADARGFLVLRGRADELERDLPFWVFVDALDDYVAGLAPRRLGALGADVLGELATVLPSLPAPAGRPAALAHERYRSHRAVRALLELLAGSQPLLVVLDDLHWGDPASIELLGALLRGPPAAPLLLALAVRPRQMSERLAVALERAHRSRSLARLELGPLTPAEAGELLGAGVDRAVASALYEESGGNPFYLEQLARTFGGDRAPAASSPDVSLGSAEVPAAVVAALVEELALLSRRARRLLEGAAVAGDPFDPELASAAAGAGGPATLDALDELLRLDLVCQTEVPRRFRFRHPLVRRAVYEAMPGGRRLSSHERAADALLGRGASATTRAHHVERAACQGDLAAVATLREAGDVAARRAPASAARWFAGALRLLPDGAPAQERVELLLASAEALAATGDFAGSHVALLESIRLVPEESVALGIRLTTACAGVEHLMGRHEQAHARLATALEGLPHGTREALELMIELAVDGFYRMDYEAMGEWAGRALGAARALGDPPLTAAALAILAQACALGAALAEAEVHRSEAAIVVDALSDDELARRLDAVINLSAAEIDLDRLAEADAHAERAMAIARATGQSDVVPVVILCLGWVKRLRGRLAECCRLLDDAAESARLSGNAQSLAGNLLNRSLTALAAGDIETALATAEESVDLMRPLDRGLLAASSGLALAAALLEAGDAPRAVEVLVGPAGDDGLALVPTAWRANWLELLTRCLLASGRPDEAARAAAGAISAAAGGRPLARALADRAAAAVALDSGDAASGARLALASAAAADAVGVPVEAGLSRILAGRALGQAGQRALAVGELERAAAELHACGAARYRDRAESELRKLGHRVHRRTLPGTAGAPGLASLTGRELEVARLVADLRTNPEIASALFLSRRTVETHVRNIFTKLDVSSRAEIARAVERAGREGA